MRTEKEIRAMVATLERLMEANAVQFEETFDESYQMVFNHDGTLVSALRWVLGEDTLKHEVMDA